MNWTILVEFVEQNLLPILAALFLGQFITLVFLLVLWSKKRWQSQAPAHLSEYMNRLDQLEKSLRSLQEQLVALQARQASAIQYVGFSRYNAFPDVGGGLSFSLVLLNGKQDGIVLTSLYSRQEARVYAKPIQAGSSSVRLSPEEQAVLQQAIYSKNS